MQNFRKLIVAAVLVLIAFSLVGSVANNGIAAIVPAMIAFCIVLTSNPLWVSVDESLPDIQSFRSSFSLRAPPQN